MAWHMHSSQRIAFFKTDLERKDIFSAEGLALFIEDMSKISDFFLHHNFRVRIGDEPADRQPKAVVAAIEP